MTPPIDSDAPRESRTIRLPAAELAAFREWVTEGTPPTAARVRDPEGRVALVRNRRSDGRIPPVGAVEPGETPRADLHDGDLSGP